jgi:hypothetical protein
VKAYIETTLRFFVRQPMKLQKMIEQLLATTIQFDSPAKRSQSDHDEETSLEVKIDLFPFVEIKLPISYIMSKTLNTPSCL